MYFVWWNLADANGRFAACVTGRPSKPTQTN